MSWPSLRALGEVASVEGCVEACGRFVVARGSRCCEPLGNEQWRGKGRRLVDVCRIMRGLARAEASRKSHQKYIGSRKEENSGPRGKEIQQVERSGSAERWAARKKFTKDKPLTERNFVKTLLLCSMDLSLASFSTAIAKTSACKAKVDWLEWAGCGILLGKKISKNWIYIVRSSVTVCHKVQF